MRQIPLSQGQVALVDDQDYPDLAEFKWSYWSERDGRQGYAVRNYKIDGKTRLCYLQRQLVQAPPGREVIFLNHDRLDCRRENLSVVTIQEARQHHRVRRDSKSGIKGVRYNPDGDTWSAVMYRDGHCHHIGTYTSQYAAEMAEQKALRHENPELHTAPAVVE